ncbi:MAG: sugar phosphate nucleotidyltransferase [Candidatus Thermoplasmatota archaeon]
MKVLAMLLAGGVGSRMNVLASVRAKPAIPFAGIYRLIDFTLSNIMYSGIESVGILTQYKPLSLMDHIGDGKAWDFVGRKRKAKILPPRTGEEASDWYKGTADAIYQNIDFIKDNKTDDVLILSGDHIYKMDYSDVLNFYKEKDADLVVCMIKVPIKEASRFGIGEMDSENRIVGWEEKPQNPKTNLASMGIYVFNTDLLLTRLKEKPMLDFGRDAVKRMIEKDRVFGYLFDGYWRDVGTVVSYWEANMDAIDRTSGLDLEKFQVRTNLEYGIGDLPPALIKKDAVVKNSLISPGCIIEGKVYNSVLSPNVYVMEKATISNSIVMHGSSIGNCAKISKGIIDKNVKVGSNVSIGFGEEVENKKFPTHIYDGLVLIGKNVCISKNVEIGKNTIVYPFKNVNEKIGGGEVVF